MKDIDHQLALLGLRAAAMWQSLSEGDYDYSVDQFTYSPEANVARLAGVATIIELLIRASDAGDEEEVRQIIGCLSQDDADAIRRMSTTKEAQHVYVKPIQILRDQGDGYDTVSPRKDRDSRSLSATEFMERFREEVAGLVETGVSPDKAESVWLDREAARIVGWKPSGDHAEPSARDLQYRRKRDALYQRVYRNG